MQMYDAPDAGGFAPYEPNGRMELPDDITKACRRGDAGVTLQWADRDEAHLAARSPNGETLLHWACTSRTPALVRALLERGIHANVQNWRGTCALIYAATEADGSEGGDGVIAVMLEYGADAREISGFSAQTPGQTAKTPGAKALLSDAATNINDAIDSNSHLRYRYRRTKWMRDTVNYLELSPAMRQAQFPANYHINPQAEAAHSAGGLVAAWRVCTAANKNFMAFAAGPRLPRCAHCDGTAAPIKCPHCDLRFCDGGCQANGKFLHDVICRGGFSSRGGFGVAPASDPAGDDPTGADIAALFAVLKRR